MPTARTHRWIFPFLVNLCLLVGFSLLLILGIKRFELWPPIETYIGVCPMPTPLDIFATRNPQAMRYLLLWPFAKAALFFHSDIVRIFPGMALAGLFLMSLVQAATLRCLRPASAYDSRWYSTRFLLVWMFIALFMHGRLVSDFLGTSIILHAEIRFLIRQRGRWQMAALHLLGLLLCSVSTGTFGVAFFMTVTFLVTLPLIASPYSQAASARRILPLGLAIAALMGPFMAQYIAKNLLYFDSLSQMLLHGPPNILYGLGVPMPVLEILSYGFLAIVCVSTTAGYVHALRHHYAFTPVILLVGFALMIGIFGYSTLLAMLPGVLLMAMLYVPPWLQGCLTYRKAQRIA